MDYLHRLGDDFLAYAVSRDDGDAPLAFLFRVHGRKVNTIAIIGLGMRITALQVHGQGLGAVGVSDYRGATTSARFGDPQGEFAVLRSGCGIYDLGFRAKICLTGSD